MAFVAVLDACVLVPHPLFDTLLRAADAGLYEPRWSTQILDEVERTLVTKMGVSREQAARRVAAMQAAFPHAQVDGHEDLIAVMRNHPKDRHVLAAAVRAGAGAIVTANLKDFPPAALEPYAVEALHPDDLLLDLLDLDQSVILRLLEEQAQAYVNPPIPLTDLRRHLSTTVPKFAAASAATLPTSGKPLSLAPAPARSADPAPGRRPLWRAGGR